MANIVVCADGTWNRPEEDIEKDFPTNVLKLARSIAPRAGEKKQHVFYDWGLGSYHSSITAGATGSGIHKNVLDGYRYIVQNYASGDRIYLFGFSRGAYTVRALCGLINNCGIVKRNGANLINRAWEIYKSPASKNHPDGNNAKDFRQSHSHLSRNVHFVGVWDTVGALGIPISVMGLLDGNDEFYDTKMGANVKFARHALAIDEKRVDFEPTVWQPRTGVDLKQVWFCGVHADIGGSYPPDKNGQSIADIALGWMIDQAVSADLTLEPHLKAGLSEDEGARLHESRRNLFRFKSSLHRPIEREGISIRIHPIVRRRYESNASYRPPELERLVNSKGWANMDVGT